MSQRKPQSRRQKPAEMPETENDRIAGRNPVMEALRSGARIDMLYVGQESGGLQEIISLAKEQGIPVKVVTESKLTQLTGGAVHQGVAAEGACGTYVSLEELLERAAEKGEPPLLVLCDGIQDPHNLGAEAGIQEVVLTGIHLSSYGREIDGESHLIELIEAIHPIDGISRIRLGSLEPRIITEEFVGRLKKLHKVCPHFHLSLQSGCEETLKRMNRHYTPEEYYEKCKLLRAAFENPAITTDVIVGFPGETDEEFDKTRQFLEKVHFYEMHIFRYSRRKGTRADKMENQIPEETKAQRSGILSSLESQMTKEFRTKWTGACVKVLLEERQEINGVSYMVGHTPEYIKCAVETDAPDNTIIDAIIEGELTADVMKARQG